MQHHLQGLLLSDMAALDRPEDGDPEEGIHPSKHPCKALKLMGKPDGTGKPCNMSGLSSDFVGLLLAQRSMTPRDGPMGRV